MPGTLELSLTRILSRDMLLNSPRAEYESTRWEVTLLAHPSCFIILDSSMSLPLSPKLFTQSIRQLIFLNQQYLRRNSYGYISDASKRLNVTAMLFQDTKDKFPSTAFVNLVK